MRACQANRTGTFFKISKQSNRLVQRDAVGLHTLPFHGTRFFPGTNAGHDRAANWFRSRTNRADIAGRDPGWLPHYRLPAGSQTRDNY